MTVFSTTLYDELGRPFTPNSFQRRKLSKAEIEYKRHMKSLNLDPETGGPRHAVRIPASEVYRRAA